MSFIITARTILHLGADLISSDAVAIYELIKNSIDAESKTGVDVRFDITIKQADFAAAMSALDDAILEEEILNDILKQTGEEGGVNEGELPTLDELKENFLSHIQSEASEELKSRFISEVQRATDFCHLRELAQAAYRDCNRITVSDTGHGMSEDDLENVYLTIGTTSRAKAVRRALANGSNSATRPPYLGEKGVGRLSVMRLGWKVRVESMTAEDEYVNVLDIDWKDFERADDAEASSIKIAPRRGAIRAQPGSFTRIEITDLRSSWSRARLTQIATEQIARMMDPFSWAGRRFQIRLSINGVPVSPVNSVAQSLLQHAHGKCIGKFSIVAGQPQLTAKVEAPLYRGAPKHINFDVVDLMSMSGLRDAGHSSSVLKNLGPFSFELYWFNRQKIRALPDVGDREQVRRLIRTWAGVCLFRDGYRVLPYGDPGDDWLGLDLTALASSGYKLNTKQIIGRVAIGRLSNPRLLDQTNRQGLVEMPERDALISLLRELVSRWWHDYLNEVSATQKRDVARTFDSSEENTIVDSLEARAAQSLREIRKDYKGEAQLLREVKDAFAEIKDAHQRAVQRILSIEEEKERLTQLAGVGLLVEVIAHELARATELTQATLKDLSRKSIDVDAASALHTLGQQIKVIQKRLQALEPLSVSARFRRVQVSLQNVLDYILEGHTEQFKRHQIDLHWHDAGAETAAFVVEGHLVQIIENLINNSVYWLELERRKHPSFVPQIGVKVLSSPPRIIYWDNGPGIPENRKESVFEPFFSTKPGSKSRRFGLGLYIARQNAETLGGSLELVRLGEVRPDRYNVFELTLRERPNEP